MTTYNATFFDYVNAGSVRSAEIVLPILLRAVGVDSVLDVGCGQGAWLSVCLTLGVADAVGLDGDYVDREKILVPSDLFVPCDLTSEFDLARSFDLVMSLEVAEHLSSSCSAGFVASLVRHGDIVLFSSATKGQGGHHHVNEQDYEYWRDLFAGHGYQPIDYLRPLVKGDKRIEPWYRYNPILYVSPLRLGSLLPEVQACLVAEHKTIEDMSPLTYRVRKAFLRLLPVAVKTQLAKIKERLSEK